MTAERTDDKDGCGGESALEEAGEGDPNGREEQNIIAGVRNSAPVVAFCKICTV